jgi:hypothetical protein
VRRLVLLAVFFLGLDADANAQRVRGFDEGTRVGVHYSGLVNEYPNEAPQGVGAFVTISRGPVGLDAATTFFFPAGLGDSLWQVLAGPRVGVTWRDVAVFGRARAGFGRFSQRFFKPGVICIAISPPPDSCLADRFNLHVDLGGTLEVGLSPLTTLRFDLGDTLTRWSGAPPEAQWTHGFQFAVGVGWRF